jgi:hypothetical protein
MVQIKNICENKIDNNEDIWFKLLEQLYKFELQSEEIINLYKDDEERKKTAEDLHESIIKEIKELLEKMSTFVKFRKLIDEVARQNKNAGYQEFRDITIDILRSYTHFTRIVNSAKDLVNNLIYDKEQECRLLNSKGEILGKFCDICKKQFKKEKSAENIYFFMCGHTFHENCLEEENKNRKVMLCCICNDLDIINEKEKPSGLNKNMIKKVKTSKKFKVEIPEEWEKYFKMMEKYNNQNSDKNSTMLNKSIHILDGEYRKLFKD